MLTLFTIFVALAVSWFTVSRDMRMELDELAVENIGVRTAAFMKDLEEYVKQNPGDAIPGEFLESRAGILGVRITVIGPDGTVLGDSEVAPGQTDALDNHRNRPEVRGARTSG
ncbi:MAG: hypothetical protein LBU26_04470, partial [Synergistaceae bacterium]|nr:hypothetical protein [Synergistaceae bacterium]